jgi:hypothetical protein
MVIADRLHGYCTAIVKRYRVTKKRIQKQIHYRALLAIAKRSYSKSNAAATNTFAF